MILALVDFGDTCGYHGNSKCGLILQGTAVWGWQTLLEQLHTLSEIQQESNWCIGLQHKLKEFEAL